MRSMSGARAQGCRDGTRRYLVCDFDAYFCACEAMDRGWTGVPVAVSTDRVVRSSSTLIAVDYLCRAAGVSKGANAGEVRRQVPGVRVVAQRPLRYAQIHREVLGVVDRVRPLGGRALDRRFLVPSGRGRRSGCSDGGAGRFARERLRPGARAVDGGCAIGVGGQGGRGAAQAEGPGGVAGERSAADRLRASPSRSGRHCRCGGAASWAPRDRFGRGACVCGAGAGARGLGLG